MMWRVPFMHRKGPMGSYVTASTIKELREAKGLTQRALAERLGVTDKAVSCWESGRGANL